MGSERVLSGEDAGGEGVGKEDNEGRAGKESCISGMLRLTTCVLVMTDTDPSGFLIFFMEWSRWNDLS
jgi:hypothetical protein